MIPLLYQSTETTFASNGIGCLSDVISCIVTEERNGGYELEMEYPVDGIHFENIDLRMLILAKPNTCDNPQPFRVYKISKPLNGKVKINAEHISYDLTGICLSPYTVSTLADALAGFQTYAATANPFTFTTDKTSNGSFKIEQPSTLRSYMGGVEGSIIDVYGGEWKYDKFTARLLNSRGANRGVTIRYGKNLTSLQQEENCSSVYTGIYPYYKATSDTTTTIVKLNPPTINTGTIHNYTRIQPLDLSSEFSSKPNETQLRNKAESWLNTHTIDVPAVSLKVSYAQLQNSEEYKDMALLEEVRLCDTVTVYYPKLGVSATAKCIKLVYDVLLERVDSVELGDAKQTVAKTIAGQSSAISTLSGRTGGGGGSGAVSLAVVLIAANWANNAQTISVEGVTSDNTITVGPAPSSMSAYGSSGVKCVSQGEGTLTFNCSTTPSVNLTANLTIQR